jgi:hypothetical protein
LEGFLPAELQEEPNFKTLIKFAKEFYHPKRSEFEKALLLNEADVKMLQLIKNVVS